MKTHTVRVGDLFYTSWGYDQTNVDFYQVVALKGKTQVALRKINYEVESCGMMTGKKKAIPDKFANDKLIIKKVRNYNDNNTFEIESFVFAYPTTADRWHYFTSYA